MTAIHRLHSYACAMQWWQWGQALGIVLPLALLAAGVDDRLLWAVALHLFADFVVQSDATSRAKAAGQPWPLLHHSLVSGGLPAFVLCGFCLPGLVFGVAVHWLIDRTNKFGLAGSRGWQLDQAAHLLTICFIALVF